MLNSVLAVSLGVLFGWLGNLQLGSRARLSSDILSGAIGAIFSAMVFQWSTLAERNSWDFIPVAIAGAIIGLCLQRISRSKRLT